MYICIYGLMYIYIHVYIYIHTHTFLYKYKYLYICIYTYYIYNIYVYKYTYMHMYIYEYWLSFVSNCTDNDKGRKICHKYSMPILIRGSVTSLLQHFCDSIWAR